MRENKSGGWIKLYRKSLDSAVFRNANLWKIWSWCLIKANHENGYKILFAGKEIELSKGQFITGRFQGAKECNMKTSTFRNQLRKLKNIGNLDIKSDNKKSLITVVNWKEYQCKESEKDSKEDIRRTSEGHQKDTNKKLRSQELKEIKEIFEFWNSLKIVEHRKLTDQIKRKINGKLEDYQIEDVRQAIKNYSIILKSENYYWTHKWTLEDFLQKGLDRFLDWDIAKNNFINKNGNKKRDFT